MLVSCFSWNGVIRVYDSVLSACAFQAQRRAYMHLVPHQRLARCLWTHSHRTLHPTRPAKRHLIEHDARI